MEPHLVEGKGKHVHPRKLPFQFTDDVNFVSLSVPSQNISSRFSLCVGLAVEDDKGTLKENELIEIREN